MNFRYFLLIFFIIVGEHRLNAQTEIAGNEQYNSYEQLLIVDNLSQTLIPHILLQAYYLKLKPSGYSVLQTLDVDHNKRYFIIHTKKARDGFLFVNKSIMDAIASDDYELDNLKVSYVYNGKAIRTNKDALFVIRLRKRNIRISEIRRNKQLGSITAFIESK